MNKCAWSGKGFSGTQTRLEVEARADAGPWRSAIDWVPLHGSSCFAQDHLPRVTPLTVIWALSHLFLVKKICRLADSSVLKKHFSR